MFIIERVGIFIVLDISVLTNYGLKILNPTKNGKTNKNQKNTLLNHSNDFCYIFNMYQYVIGAMYEIYT